MYAIDQVTWLNGEKHANVWKKKIGIMGYKKNL